MEIRKLHHVSLCVSDLEASRHFYVKILGMEEAQRPESFNFPGQWFRKNGFEIHTIHTSAAGQVPGDGLNIVKPGRDITFARHLCFSVTDMEGALQTLNLNGINVVEGPRPRGDGAIQVYISNPDRHLVELVYEPWGAV